MNFNNLVSDEISNCDDIYIYGYGLAAIWLYENIPYKNKIKAFIDTDFKKSGTSPFGIKIVTPQIIKNIIGVNSIIINTVIDIQDVVDIIKKLKHKKTIPLGLYLDDIHSSRFINNSKESDEFIYYSLEAVRNCHMGYFDKTQLYLRSIDLVITEKCSLKCNDCSNLMQYYEKPTDVSFENVVADFDSLTKNVSHFFEVRLIGGEPFMNKDIYKILEYLYSKNNITKVVIYSNAMIPINRNFDYLLKNEKLVFSLTDYGNLSKNTTKITSQLKEIGASFRLHPPENWTDSGKIFDFKRDLTSLKKIFEDCCGKNLLTVSEGNLYRCPFSANADRLKAIPYDPLNFVSVTSNKKEILKFTREIEYIPACNFCKGRSFDSPSIIPAIQAIKPLKYTKIERVI